MLKRLLTKKRYFKSIYKEQKGITGLETAIILIAFVVVAAVFAYTVLSAGLFATQQSQQAIYNGLQETQSTMEVQGDVVGYSNTDNNSLTQVAITVSLSGNGNPIDLTTPWTDNTATNSITDITDPALLTNKLQISFNDTGAQVANMPWTVTFIGKNNGDYMLDPGEKAVITVWLNSSQDGNGNNELGTSTVGTYTDFTLELKPPTGATLSVERTTPAHLDPVVDLH